MLFRSCYKLSDYSPNFKRTNYTLIALSALSLWLFASEMTVLLFSGNEFPLYAEFLFLKVIASGAMHYFLLRALMDISSEVGRTKITVKCRRNLYITLAVLLCQAVFCVPFIDFPNKSEIYRHVTDIGVNFVVILNMIQIFSCYMWICYEGDEDMDFENANDPLSKLTAKMLKENAEYKAESKKNKSNKKKKK